MRLQFHGFALAQSDRGVLNFSIDRFFSLRATPSRALTIP